MRVLLDEQLPRQLASYRPGHEVHTVQEERWAGLTNGELLKQAEAAGFELFLTGDQNLEFQQNLRQSGLRIVVLQAMSNALEDLLPLKETGWKISKTLSGTGPTYIALIHKVEAGV